MKRAGLLAFFLCWSIPLQAQVQSRALEVITWHIRVEPGAVKPGGVVRVVFQAGLMGTDEGPWKMYALGSPLPSRAVKIAFTALPKNTVHNGLVEQWGAEQGYDPWFDTTVEYFEDHALLWADLAVRPDAEEGTQEVQGEISFMVCNDSLCLPPATRPFEVVYNVSREASGALPATPPTYIPEKISQKGSRL